MNTKRAQNPYTANRYIRASITRSKHTGVAKKNAFLCKQECFNFLYFFFYFPPHTHMQGENLNIYDCIKFSLRWCAMCVWVRTNETGAHRPYSCVCVLCFEGEIAYSFYYDHFGVLRMTGLYMGGVCNINAITSVTLSEMVCGVGGVGIHAWI